MSIPNDQTIVGGPHTGHRMLLLWATTRGVSPEMADSIAIAFTVYGELTRIGNILPFAQAAHETGWFTSARWRISYNPAGLGATNDGAWGGTFRNPAEGILAQYAHLIAYAVKPEEAGQVQRALSMIDPRYDAVKGRGWLGVAPRWIDLNGRWAYPGRTYGQSIIKIANTLLQNAEDRGASVVFLDAE